MYVTAAAVFGTLIVLSVMEARDHEKQEFLDRLAFYDVLHAMRTGCNVAQSARNNENVLQLK